MDKIESKLCTWFSRQCVFDHNIIQCQISWLSLVWRNAWNFSLYFFIVYLETLRLLLWKHHLCFVGVMNVSVTIIFVTKLTFKENNWKLSSTIGKCLDQFGWLARSNDTPGLVYLHSVVAKLFDMKVQSKMATIRRENTLGPFPYLGSGHRVFILLVLRSCASSLCTAFSFMPFCITSTSVSVVLSFGVHPLPCSHYYIFFSLSLHMAQPSLSRFSYFLIINYVCHICPCSYVFIPDLLNPVYSHRPSQHSHFCSF